MRKFINKLYYFKVYTGIFVTLLFFLSIVGYIVINGFSHLNLGLLFGLNEYDESLMPAIINTLIVIALTLLLAVPIGVGSAIYLNEYAKRGSRVVKIIRIATESLAGIPSIIFGLFGFLFFVIFLKWSWSLLAGIATLAMMVLPTIIRSTEEALKSVPDAYREGSYALGATKLRTIWKVTLPSSISGILVSIILSVGRVIGETAALILTAGTVMNVPKNLFNSGATLSVYMYTLTSEGLDFNKAYAVATILLITVFLINQSANFVAKKLKRG